MTLKSTTALQLKASGFPTPEPAPGQFWYDGSGFLCCCVLQPKMAQPYNHRLKPLTGIALFGTWYGAAFAPTLDDITPYLPEGFVLQIWDGLPSCTNRYDENLIRTTGETFAEAAAKMWLEIQKQPEP